MNKTLETIKNVRIYLLKLTEELSIEQLNEVPAGFNNNIIWNMGHLIAAQQGICYKRSGLETKIDEDFFLSYKPGSKPEGFVDVEGVENIKTLLLETIDQLETDFNNNLFTTYISATTRYGVELSCIDDGIRFLPFHDGLHIGYVMALKRVIAQ